MKDESGKRYGALLIVEPFATSKAGAHWLCMCDCGQSKVVKGSNLRYGHVSSCGCKSHLDTVSTMVSKRHPDYYVWTSMKKRCNNPNASQYKNYGARGIRVCNRWMKSFEDFISDMGPRPGKDFSIDRIDFDGHYEPGNCRWVQNAEQHRNTRWNRFITFEGRTRQLSDWCRDAGISTADYHTQRNKGVMVVDILKLRSA